MFRFLIGHLLKRDLQQVNEPFNKLFVRSFLKNYFNRYRQYYSYDHWSFCVYRYTAICMSSISSRKGLFTFCSHFANTEHFKGFFSLFFLTLAQRKHVFFASSLLSNCMRSRILSNYLNQIFYQVFFFQR